MRTKNSDATTIINGKVGEELLQHAVGGDGKRLEMVVSCRRREKLSHKSLSKPSRVSL